MHDYFAAANTAEGFVSWFDDIFAPESLARTYIIKGGSGTGKSTLMKRAAAACENAGGMVERFWCSSDAASLDGVLLHTKNGTFAMLDGTAPHTRDPRYPGAAEEIFNPGMFWDDGVLTARREEILALTGEKSALYAGAYRDLAAAGVIARMLLDETAAYILHAKLDAAMMRLLTQRMKASHTKPADAPVRRIRGLSAISTQGEVFFDGAREGYEVLLAADAMGSVPMLFDALRRAADALGLSYDRAPMPLLPALTEAMSFPDLHLCVLSRTNADCRPLNMRRFLDRDFAASADRARMKELRRTKRLLLDAALSKLAEVSRVHGALEKIYISAMDFDRLQAAGDGLIGRILG